MELVTTIVGHVVELSIKPLTRQTSYIFRYKSKAENLRHKVQHLEAARERVQSYVIVATRKGEEILQNVKNWQDRASQIAQEPEKRLEDGEAKCFFGLCPNLKARCELGKKAEEEAGAIAKLLEEEGRFHGQVSHPVDPQEIWATSSKSSVAFESRKFLLNEILGALKDANLERIGVYGVAGVGKTTLVKEIARVAKADKLFDVVALAIVTQTLDVRKIQAEIADFLGLKFDEESVNGRANRLSGRLRREKKVLVILDDIWTSLKLDEVGIVFKDNEHRGCKVLLTSRHPNFFSEMDAEKLFRVDLLQEEEAWNLFKKMAGDIVEKPEVRSTAIDACRSCAGLPIAIVTAAKALKKNETFAGWENALKQLKGLSPTMPADPRSAIELSFNHLANEDLKSAFLLCGLMPYNATIFDLLKYGVAFGLLRGIRTMEEARQRLHRLVQNLKSSCLLLDGRMAEEFTMHDVIRDVAASIASRDRKMFFMRNETGPRGLPDAGMLRNCSAISLFYNDFINLPDELDCPQLKSFQLYNKNPALRISDQFFNSTKALEVLDLKGLQLLSLPSSLGLLADLHTLCLESCLLQEIAMVGNLKKLEILSFCSSILEELPKEIGQLTQLKLLNLDNCSKLRVIPPNVISNLSQLEELYMGNSFAQWKDEQRAGHASLCELKHLPHLTSLDLQIPDSHNMPKELFSEKLQRFRILIGDPWDWLDKYETSRMLKLKLNESIHVNYGVQMLLKKTEDLYVDELKHVRSVLYELDDARKGFPQLKHLHVQNSSEMKHIINSIEALTLNAFPLLESLYLQNLISLEKICNGQLRKQPFEKLRVVNVRSCHRLKNLFSSSIARGLLQLQEIEVFDCKNMVEIIAEGRENDVGENEATTKVEFGRLQLLTLQQVPKLISFNASTTAMALFNQRVTFPNLKNLKLSSINTSQIWHNQLLSVPTCIQNLTSMTVEGCGNLKFVLSSSMVNSLERLIHLEISDCKLIEEIIEGMTGEEGMEKILFPQLNSLKIKGLPRLTRFCSGKGVEFPSLKQLQLEHCPQLETFISKLEMRALKRRRQPLFNEKVAFPSLEKLTIFRLKSLTMLWDNQLPEDSFCKLKTMEVEYCEELRTIFPLNMVGRFQKLETLHINDAASLREVFEVQGLNVEENEAEAAVPLKKLYMYNLPKLKSVWSKDPQGIISFQDLKFVYAFGCQSLKNLFRASVARGLQQLDRLEIDTCAVEEIVAEDETPQPETRFVFPELSALRLWNLQKLESFYPGLHSTEWPKLKTLLSYHVGHLKIFTSELLSIEKTWRVSQPLLLVEKVVHNLEEISLNSNDISILSHDEVFPAELFGKIKVLQVHCYHQDSAIFPFRFVQKLTNVEKLDVGCCKFRELFPSGGVQDEENHPRTLARVRSLKLASLPNLSHIWQPGSRVDLILPCLEALVVWHCNSLVNLAQSASSFSNLTTLDVWNCHGAKNIIAYSTARSLVQLTKMSIRECNKVREIVADDDDEEEEEEEETKEIIFSKLVCLELNGLPGLLYFSSGNHALKFPSLEDVTVKQCPNLAYFSRRELSTPKLHKVWLTEEKDQSCWNGDLNAIATLYDTSGKMVSGTRGHLGAASYSIRDD